MATLALSCIGISQDEPIKENNSEEVLAEVQNDTEVSETAVNQYVPYNGIVDLETVKANGVYNRADKEIGNIDRFIAASDTGQITHAVVSVGGFLGIGDKLVSVPWSQLQFMAKAPAPKIDVTAPETATESETTNQLEESDESVAADTEAESEKAEDKPDDPAVETYAENAEDPNKSDLKSHQSASVRVYLDTTEEQLKNAAPFNPENPQSVENSQELETEKSNKDPFPES